MALSVLLGFYGGNLLYASADYSSINTENHVIKIKDLKREIREFENLQEEWPRLKLHRYEAFEENVAGLGKKCTIVWENYENYVEMRRIVNVAGGIQCQIKTFTGALSSDMQSFAEKLPGIIKAMKDDLNCLPPQDDAQEVLNYLLSCSKAEEQLKIWSTFEYETCQALYQNIYCNRGKQGLKKVVDEWIEKLLKERNADPLFRVPTEHLFDFLDPLNQDTLVALFYNCNEFDYEAIREYVTPSRGPILGYSEVLDEIFLRLNQANKCEVLRRGAGIVICSGNEERFDEMFLSLNRENRRKCFPVVMTASNVARLKSRQIERMFLSLDRESKGEYFPNVIELIMSQKLPKEVLEDMFLSLDQENRSKYF